MNLLQRTLSLLMAISLVATSTPVQAATLKERLDAIDRLEETFRKLDGEQWYLKKYLREFEPCLTGAERTTGEIDLCIERSTRIQSAATWSKRHISDLAKAITEPELQPVPDSLSQRFATLTSTFDALTGLTERLEREANDYLFNERPDSGSRDCDTILRNERPTRSDEIVVDVGVMVCKAVRQPMISFRTRSSFMEAEKEIRVRFDDDTHVGSGESEAEGAEDGDCIGRGCGESYGDDYGGGEGEPGGGEGRSAYKEERYNKESVRSYAESEGRTERPAPLNDDQIMAIERQRFEKETGEKTWATVEAASTATHSTNAKLAEIPQGKLYELAPQARPVPSSSRIVAKIPGAAKSIDSTTLSIRLNSARGSLESAKPTTWQSQSAKTIGLAAVDEGQTSLAKGELEDANQATEIAEGMADLALGFTPGVGWAKDVFEAVTGKNLVTGKDLDGFERSFAFFGAISLGLGSKVGAAIKAANRIGRLAAKMGTANRAFVGAQKAARAAVQMSVRTRDEFEGFIAFSKRTFGNEIGAIGHGYEQLVKQLGLRDASQLWTSTAERTVVENLEYHADKHAPKFLGVTSIPDYVIATHNFIKNPPQGTLKKIRGTDRLFYEPSTNTFAVATDDFVPRTMFKPKPAMQYWLRQPGKDVP